MTDVTEHSTRVLADRMELITKSLRVPERLDRLENAAAAGLLGGGGGAVLNDCVGFDCLWSSYSSIGWLATHSDPDDV